MTKQKLTFAEKCYQLLKQVPKGKVTTYKEIAQALNCKAYRAVGNAMSKNPNAPAVPCHRVVTSNGLLGGYAYGLPKKIAILEKEGVKITAGKVANFEEKLYRFSSIK